VQLLIAIEVVNGAITCAALALLIRELRTRALTAAESRQT